MTRRTRLTGIWQTVFSRTQDVTEEIDCVFGFATLQSLLDKSSWLGAVLARMPSGHWIARLARAEQLAAAKLHVERSPVSDLRRDSARYCTQLRKPQP
jgi:hypothetical protein